MNEMKNQRQTRTKRESRHTNSHKEGESDAQTERNTDTQTEGEIYTQRSDKFAPPTDIPYTRIYPRTENKRMYTYTNRGATSLHRQQTSHIRVYTYKTDNIRVYTYKQWKRQVCTANTHQPHQHGWVLTNPHPHPHSLPHPPPPPLPTHTHHHNQPVRA